MDVFFPYLFGATRLIIGLFLALKVIRWTSKNGQQASSIWLKTLAIACTATGLYTLIFSQPNDYRFLSSRWQESDREVLINKCLQETHEMAQDHPEIMKKYCECAVDAEMVHFSKSEYIELTKKTIAERAKVELPVCKDCLDEMQEKLKSIPKK